MWWVFGNYAIFENRALSVITHISAYLVPVITQDRNNIFVWDQNPITIPEPGNVRAIPEPGDVRTIPEPEERPSEPPRVPSWPLLNSTARGRGTAR